MIILVGLFWEKIFYFVIELCNQSSRTPQRGWRWKEENINYFLSYLNKNFLKSKKMKIVKEATINGQVVTYDELKTAMEAKGVKAAKFVDRDPATLPTSGEFVDYEPVDEGQATAHYRMIAKDAKGTEHRISVSRLQAYGLIKKTDDAVCPLIAIRKSQKGNLYIGGESINPEIPSDQAKAILSLIGQKFKAKKVTLFSLPYGENFESKEIAHQNVTTSTAYEVKFAE